MGKCEAGFEAPITYWKERIVTNALKVDKYGLININKHVLRNDFNETNMP